MTASLADIPAVRGSRAWQGFSRALFRTVAFIECVTWIGMLTSMAFKYFINGNGTGVTIFGWAHGITWLVFLASATLAAWTFRWPVWIWLAGCIGSALPFLTWPFERWMLLSHRLRSAA